MEELKHVYNLMPQIFLLWITLNILGNTIKMTFNVKSKYIVWILLLFSIVINFVFFGFSFDSLFMAFMSFSFSVSSYDLVHVITKIYKK